MNIFGAFEKVEKQDDGTLKVWGYASSERKDADGEVITADAMKAAIPDYMKFGAVREMHKTLAAGTAIEIEVQEDGRTFFGAHVVDPIAVKKVETGVYKGFSIGGGILGRDPLNKSIVNKIKLTEISLVDRPNNPDSVFTLVKIDGNSETETKEPEDKETEETKTKESEQDDKAPTESTEKVEAKTDGEKLNKSIWNLKDFAGVIQSIYYICCSAKSESDYNAQNSALPAQLKEWLTAGIAIYQNMTNEETARLIADLETRIQKTEGVDDLQKAGAAFNAKNKQMLKSLHDTVKACVKMLDDLGYESSESEETEKIDSSPATGEPLQKIEKELAETLQKVSDLEKANKDLLEKFNSLPAQAKGSLMSVSKEADRLEKSLKSEEETPPPEGTTERAEWEMKKVIKAGGIGLANI